ncbi:MAG: FHA domain-containing protein [Anaerolineae bacterium]|nr:FHA domain-containing protein [Phycisphaerae bacterium]
MIITSGQNKGTTYKLDKLPMSVGREVQRDIQIMDPKVSRKHFVLKKDGENILISGDAKNGIYINGKKTEGETALKDSDRIIVGETELTYLVNDDPARVDAFNKMRQLSPAARAPTII